MMAAVDRTLKWATPVIWNSDQGAQFTSTTCFADVSIPDLETVLADPSIALADVDTDDCKCQAKSGTGVTLPQKPNHTE
jgi:hypothetical protein